MFTRVDNTSVLREVDGVVIPVTDAGFVAWQAAGNSPMEPIPSRLPSMVAVSTRSAVNDVLRRLVNRGVLSQADLPTKNQQDIAAQQPFLGSTST